MTPLELLLTGQILEAIVGLIANAVNVGLLVAIVYFGVLFFARLEEKVNR